MQDKKENRTFSFFKELAEHLDQILFAYDFVGNCFKYINPAFEDLLRITRESIMREPGTLLASIHPEDKDFVIQSYQELINGEVKKELTFRFLLPDDTERWVNMKAYIIDIEGDKKGIAGLVSDKTEEKQNHNNILKFAAKKNSVLEILSHDLAGPFSDIKGLSTLMAKDLKKYEDPRLDKMIGMIANTSERSIQLIREFVKQEFLESSNVQLIKEREDIVAKIKEVIDQYQDSQQKIAKIFELHTSSDKIFVKIDSYKFAQVINNLISNAIKFTYDNGVITTHIEEKKDTVLVVISDNGIGIPANRQNELFEKFTRARRPGIKGEPSVGLGMSIIKTIVEWHEGKIWFESEENKGTTFYIELPKE